MAAVFEDADEHLALLDLEEGSSLTRWQLKSGEDLPPVTAKGMYPIFGAHDALAAHNQLRSLGVDVDEPVDAGPV